MINCLRDELNKSSVKVCSLGARLARPTPFSDESLHDHKYVRFYTRLPNLGVLKSVFEFVAPPIYSGLPNLGVLKSVFESVPPLIASATKLTHFQEFMVTLIKLRPDPPLKDLAYPFDVCSSSISRIMLKWLTILDTRLKDLIFWPTWEALQKTMPRCFHASFGEKITVILDWFEISLNNHQVCLSGLALGPITNITTQWRLCLELHPMVLWHLFLKHGVVE